MSKKSQDKKERQQHIRWGRVLLTFAVVVGGIVGTDSLRRSFTEYDNTIVINGDFRDPNAPGAESAATLLGNNNVAQPSSQANSGISYLGYSEISMPASQLSSGLLAVIDAAHPAAADSTAETVCLADVKNDFYTLRSDELALDEEAAQALNRMMADYNSATGLSDFIVYSTDSAYLGEDSVCTRTFPESSTYLTVDLAVQGSRRVLEYDGCDEEAWVAENCSEYGFIVRYPQGKEASTGQSGCVWHLRYVGGVHAAVMAEKGLCLEEYLSMLKGHNISSPLRYQYNGVNYEIYYTASLGDSTPVRVPVSGNYSVSGNNTDGFIVTAVK